VLARPPAIDVHAVRAMGLVVVGQLAIRLGAKVELRPGPRLGTIAEVALPGTLIRPVPLEEELPTAGRPALAGSLDAGIRLDGPIPVSPAPAGMNIPRPTHVINPPTPPIPPLPPAPPPPPGSNGGLPAQRAAGRAPVREIDQTQELVIFEQVNSWFRADHAGVGVEEEQPAVPNWSTPGDEGWRVASEIGTPEVTATTRGGLPIRQAGRHLVPGAVPPAPEQQARSERRDPAQVASAMSAYARGVAGRRPLANASPINDATGEPS